MTEETDEVALSGMSMKDLLGESIAGLFSRPGRMVLTILGTVIGLAALVATIGLSQTASNRILGRFDALAATEVVIGVQASAVGLGEEGLPWDAPERMLRLNGVVAAGNMSPVEGDNLLVTTSLIADPKGQGPLNIPIRGVSPGLFTAVRADLGTGRVFDQGHSDRADLVAVLGPSAALRLGITRVDQLPAIAIGDNLFVVIGILEDVGRKPELLGAVIIPEGTAQEHYGLLGPELVEVETEIGAASLIAAQAPLALRPDDPTTVTVASPEEPQRVKDAVQSDLNVLFLLLGGVSLLVGAIGIANVTLVSVIERTGEIGLRRALGATQSHIAVQFLFESGTLGLVGGIVGSTAGTLIVIGVAAAQNWTPVLAPWLPLAAPAVGLLIGVVSGAYPAARAAAMEPVDALRAGT